jgi:hypothetical protein
VGAVRKTPREDPVYAPQLVQDVRHILHPVQRVVPGEHCRVRGVDVLDAQKRWSVPNAYGREPRNMANGGGLNASIASLSRRVINHPI